MKLKNHFTENTRNIWMGHWSCLQCQMNGNNRGGLELHHITGRDSNATVNGAVVCGECHKHFGHSKEEEKELFQKNLEVLRRKQYKLTDNDLQFMKEHPHLIL